LEEAGNEKGDSDNNDGDDDKDGKYNRAEKKARKAIAKLGLKAVAGVERVVVRKNKNVAFVISKPDVFKTSESNASYVIFGDAQLEDAGAGAMADFGRAAGGMGNADAYARAAAQIRQSVGSSSKASGGDLEETTDETGLEARDIELVMTQASVSRGKAVAALKKCNGDLVSAIMEVTQE